MPEHDLQNILVIDLGQLGDVVLSLPALAAIRERFPDSRITTLTGKVPGEVVELSGLADEVVRIDRVELRDGPKHKSIAGVISLVGDVRRRPLDLVIDLHSLPETNILAFLSRARSRLLANREGRSIDKLSNYRPAPPKEDKNKHLTDRYLDVLRPLGITDAPRFYRLVPDDQDVLAFRRKYFETSAERPVGLFPGAGHPSRCWRLENFASLARRLAADGYRSFVFLGPEEAGMQNKIAEIFPASSVAISGLSIREFIAAASQMEVFVTNDTGPMHLAACAGTRITLLLDERAPETYLPLTPHVEIVRNGTIDSIAVDDAYEAVLRSLALSGRDE